MDRRQTRGAQRTGRLAAVLSIAAVLTASLAAALTPRPALAVEWDVTGATGTAAQAGAVWQFRMVGPTFFVPAGAYADAAATFDSFGHDGTWSAGWICGGVSYPADTGTFNRVNYLQGPYAPGARLAMDATTGRNCSYVLTASVVFEVTAGNVHVTQTNNYLGGPSSPPATAEPSGTGTNTPTPSSSTPPPSNAPCWAPLPAPYVGPPAPTACPSGVPGGTVLPSPTPVPSSSPPPGAYSLTLSGYTINHFVPTADQLGKTIVFEAVDYCTPGSAYLESRGTNFGTVQFVGWLSGAGCFHWKRGDSFYTGTGVLAAGGSYSSSLTLGIPSSTDATGLWLTDYQHNSTATVWFDVTADGNPPSPSPSPSPSGSGGESACVTWVYDSTLGYPVQRTGDCSTGTGSPAPVATMANGLCYVPLPSGVFGPPQPTACPPGSGGASGGGTGGGGPGGAGPGAAGCYFDGNPVNLPGFLGCQLAAMFDAIVNLPGTIITALYNLIVPDGAGITADWTAFLTQLQDKVPFGWITQVQMQMAAASTAFKYGLVKPWSFTYAGTTVDIGSALYAAGGAVMDWRPVMAAVVVLLGWIGIMRKIAGVLGVSSSPEGGSSS